MFPRLIHGLLVISTSFLFMTESYSILRIYNILLLIEILDCLQFRAFMNNASLNICVQIFVWLQVLNCVNYIPGNRTAGSYGNFFSLNLRNSQTLFPERLNHFAFLPATQEGSNGIPLCSYIHFPNDPEHLFIYFLVTGLSFL